MRIPVPGDSPQKKREIKPTLRSANDFGLGAGNTPRVEVVVADDNTSPPSTVDDPPAQSGGRAFGQADAEGRGAAPADPRDDAGATDAESNLVTLPIGARRPKQAEDLSIMRTLPASVPRPAVIVEPLRPVATLELSTGRPPGVVAPFPIAPARPARSQGLAEMSGARVLLLGFVAGAILMAIVGVVYFRRRAAAARSSRRRAAARAPPRSPASPSPPSARSPCG
jgi:hypothetical protein